MCLTWSELLKANSVSNPAKPFSLVAKGTLCQELKFSSMDQDCQPMVKPHSAPPEAMILLENSPISSQVSGARSRPALLNAFLFQNTTGVEELNGIDSNLPSVVV
jgi:hypothetical protein